MRSSHIAFSRCAATADRKVEGCDAGGGGCPPAAIAEARRRRAHIAEQCISAPLCPSVHNGKWQARRSQAACYDVADHNNEKEGDGDMASNDDTRMTALQRDEARLAKLDQQRETVQQRITAKKASERKQQRSWDTKAKCVFAGELFAFAGTWQDLDPRKWHAFVKQNGDAIKRSCAYDEDKKPENLEEAHERVRAYEVAVQKAKRTAKEAEKLKRETAKVEAHLAALREAGYDVTVHKPLIEQAAQAAAPAEPETRKKATSWNDGAYV